MNCSEKFSLENDHRKDAFNHSICKEIENDCWCHIKVSVSVTNKRKQVIFPYLFLENQDKICLVHIQNLD